MVIFYLTGECIFMEHSLDDSSAEDLFLSTVKTQRIFYKQKDSTVADFCEPKTIDLHGYTLEGALSLLNIQIPRCKALGIQKMTLITGYGKHSKGFFPVLKKQIKEYLNQMKETRKIKRYKENRGDFELWFDI